MTYAINTLARVTGVSVFAESILAFDNSEGGLGNKLIEGVWGAGELFASIAVTSILHELTFHWKSTNVEDVPQDMALLLRRHLNLPLDISTVALSGVGRHLGLLVWE
jgi:hypothetical protein